MQSPAKPSITTVFIDRDGVINRDSPDYIKSCEEFEFLPGSVDAFRLLSEASMNAVIITNQSAVGRKMITLDTLFAIFDKMRTGIFQAGGTLLDIFFCPHHPDDRCQCRKPEPGLILSAMDAHGIDPGLACMIGDSTKDIECARNAGCRYAILVRTGNGPAAEAELARKGIMPDHIANDLLDAVRWLLGTVGRP